MNEWEGRVPFGLAELVKELARKEKIKIKKLNNGAGSKFVLLLGEKNLLAYLLLDAFSEMDTKIFSIMKPLKASLRMCLKTAQQQQQQPSCGWESNVIG